MSDGASCRSYGLNRSIGTDAMQSDVGLTMWKSMASRRWKLAERSALGQDYRVCIREDVGCLEHASVIASGDFCGAEEVEPLMNIGQIENIMGKHSLGW